MRLFLLKKIPPRTDIESVGVIVPLPNHYNSDMPQGHGAVRNMIRAALFFQETLLAGQLTQLRKSSILKIGEAFPKLQFLEKAQDIDLYPVKGMFG